MVLPSDDLLHIPLKPVLMIVLAAGLLYLYVKKAIPFEKIYWLMLSVVLGMAVWFIIGMLNGYHSVSVLQLRALLTLLVTVVITYIFMSGGLADKTTIKKILYNVMLIKIIWKVVFELLVISHLLSIQAYRFIYDKVLDAANMTLVVKGINLFRINTANDALVLAILGFYLIDKTVKTSHKIFAVLAASYFVLIVYSRVFFAQYAFLLLIVLAIIVLRSRSKKKIALICLSVFVLLSAVSLVDLTSGHSHIMAAVNNRFNSKGTQISDMTRTQQSVYLMEDFRKSPIVGSGMGAYDPRMIRSQLNKFSYEKEYEALLMQLGVLGFCIIIVGTIILFYRFLSIGKIKDQSVKWLILLNFAIWLIKPLYNPSLVSSASASTIAALIVISFCSRGLLEQQRAGKLSR